MRGDCGYCDGGIQVAYNRKNEVVAAWECPSCGGTGVEFDAGSYYDPPAPTGQDCPGCDGTGHAPIEPSAMELEASDRNAGVAL